MILEWLKLTVFTRELVSDDRTIEDNSFLSLEIRSSVLGGLLYDDGKGTTCDFLTPDFGFYYQLVVIVSLQSIFNAFLASLVYKFIIEPQERRNKLEKKEDNGDTINDGGITSSSSTIGFLFAFGIALPAVVIEPMYLIRALGIKNVGLIMVFLATPIVNSLRIAEAVFGFTPFPAGRSFWNYVVYFSCSFGIEFDTISAQPKRVSRQFFGKRLATLARDFAIASVLISILHPYKYEFFETSREIDSMDHTAQELFSWQHLFNNYLVALLLSTSLSQSSIGVSTLYNIFYGFETYEMVLNPMFKSKSPSDFWGRRWNTLVHKGLKNGVYKPTRKQTTSKVAGALAAFVVSGIIHEYVNAVLFYGKFQDKNDAVDVNGSPIEYRFRWKQMLFFGWNGIIIMLEYCIGHWRCFKWVSDTLPRFAVTALVIFSALPLAHLFTSDYINYGFFDSVYLAEPIILCHRD